MGDPDMSVSPSGVDAGGCDDPGQLHSDGCGTLSWAASPKTSRERNHHATFAATSAAGTSLYVIGGFDGNGVGLPNVDRAVIHADGTLADFTDETPLPLATGGHAGAVTKNAIVLAGGRQSQMSYSAVIHADGSLGPWVAGGSIGQKRMHGGAFAVGDTVYMMGGFDTSSVFDDVVRTTVQADGTLSPWTPAGKLPGPRSHFTLSLVDGYVYLVGGFEQHAGGNPPNLTTVSRGQVGSDGQLGGWTTLTALPVGMAGHGAFYYGGYLYVAGGLTDALIAEDRVWRARINADHTLGAWEAAASLPIARGHVHQLPIKDNHVYSVSGALDSNLNSTTEIDIGTF